MTCRKTENGKRSEDWRGHIKMTIKRKKRRKRNKAKRNEGTTSKKEKNG